jgi:hypothetical protein
MWWSSKGSLLEAINIGMDFEVLSTGASIVTFCQCRIDMAMGLIKIKFTSGGDYEIAAANESVK